MTLSRIKNMIVNELLKNRGEIRDNKDILNKDILKKQNAIEQFNKDILEITSIVNMILDKNSEETLAKEATTLGDTIELFLKSKNGEPQTISQITDGVIALGYKSKAKRIEYPAQALLNRSTRSTCLSKRFNDIYLGDGRRRWVLEEVYQTKYNK